MTTPAYPPAHQPAGPPQQPGTDDAMTLSREQLTGQTEWLRTGGVRLRRRIVSEPRTVSVQVQVRREELVLEVDGAEFVNGVYIGRLPGQPVPPPAGPPAPVVMVLREEVPEVVMRLRPYERVTATVTPVTGYVPVSAQLAHEEAVLEQAAPGYGPEQGGQSYPPPGYGPA